MIAFDVAPPDLFGFCALRDRLGARAEFVQSTLYDRPSRVDGPFDVVACFWRAVPTSATRCSGSISWHAGRRRRGVARDGDRRYPARSPTLQPLVEFFRWGELGGDPSNWFAPTSVALEAWCRSAGFSVDRLVTWPDREPEQAIVELRPRQGVPEYRLGFYEVPLSVALTEEPRRWDAATAHAPPEPPD